MLSFKYNKHDDSIQITEIDGIVGNYRDYQDECLRDRMLHLVDENDPMYRCVDAKLAEVEVAVEIVNKARRRAYEIYQDYKNGSTEYSEKYIKEISRLLARKGSHNDNLTTFCYGVIDAMRIATDNIGDYNQWRYDYLVKHNRIDKEDTLQNYTKIPTKLLEIKYGTYDINKKVDYYGILTILKLAGAITPVNGSYLRPKYGKKNSCCTLYKYDKYYFVQFNKRSARIKLDSAGQFKNVVKWIKNQSVEIQMSLDGSLMVKPDPKLVELAKERIKLTESELLAHPDQPIDVKNREVIHKTSYTECIKEVLNYQVAKVIIDSESCNLSTMMKVKRDDYSARFHTPFGRIPSRLRCYFRNPFTEYNWEIHETDASAMGLRMLTALLMREGYSEIAKVFSKLSSPYDFFYEFGFKGDELGLCPSSSESMYNIITNVVVPAHYYYGQWVPAKFDISIPNYTADKEKKKEVKEAVFKGMYGCGKHYRRFVQLLSLLIPNRAKAKSMKKFMDKLCFGGMKREDFYKNVHKSFLPKLLQGMEVDLVLGSTKRYWSESIMGYLYLEHRLEKGYSFTTIHDSIVFCCPRTIDHEYANTINEIIDKVTRSYIMKTINSDYIEDGNVNLCMIPFKHQELYKSYKPEPYVPEFSVSIDQNNYALESYKSRVYSPNCNYELNLSWYEYYKLYGMYDYRSVILRYQLALINEDEEARSIYEKQGYYPAWKYLYFKLSDPKNYVKGVVLEDQLAFRWMKICPVVGRGQIDCTRKLFSDTLILLDQDEGGNAVWNKKSLDYMRTKDLMPVSTGLSW